MNLNYVLLGSDENSMYLDFWPIISKIWKKKFNVIPILGLICSDDSDLYENEFGFIKKFKKKDGVSTGFQSQIIRLYLSNFVNGNCIISDIDMMPLSIKYFDETSSLITDNNLIILSSDNPECISDNMYPMCYVAGHSNTFKKALDLQLSWDEFCTLLHNRNQSWFTDQKYLYEKVNQYHELNKNCIFLKRGWSGFAEKRIDRGSWSFDHNLVKSDYYIDSHLLRPYNEHKIEIDKLVNLVLETI